MKNIGELINRRSLALWLSAALAFGSMPAVPAVSVMADEKPFIEIKGEGISCENMEEGCLITIESSAKERNFAIKGVSEDEAYCLNLKLEGMDPADYPVRVFEELDDDSYTIGTVSGFPKIGKMDGELFFYAKTDGAPIENPYSMYCCVSVNLAPPKVYIVDGKFRITDEDNDPEAVAFYVASTIKMTKSEFLARFQEENEDAPFLSEIDEGPLEPGQEEKYCDADAIFIHDEMSVDDVVNRATKINPGDMLYIYSVNRDTDYEDGIEDDGWYMPETCAEILLGGYVGVAGYSVKDGAGRTISGDSISLTSSKEAQSLWFKPVSETGEPVSEGGINAITVSRNGLDADDFYLSGSELKDDYAEVMLKTKPHLGSYSISVSSNGRVSANSAERYVRDYEVSVNAAPAKVYCVSGNFIIDDEDNAKDQVYYLVSTNSISGKDLMANLDKMIEIKEGVSANVISDIVTGDILYAYTVNRDTDPEDGVDDRGVYMAREACKVVIDIPEPQPGPGPGPEPGPGPSPVKFNAYQVSGNDIIVTDVSGNSLFDVSLITGVSGKGVYESVSLNRVSSDENGNIAIDPAWLGRDIKLELSDVSSNAVYLPVVRFIDGEIALDAQAPKAGDTVVFTASSNNAYVNADIVWYSVKAGKKAELSEGDSFERGVSYNASIYVHTTDARSLLEKDLKLVQFIPGYETLPLVPYAELSDFKPVKDPVIRTDGKDAGCDNYTGYTVNADYGSTYEYLDIAGLILDDWKDIFWTENTVSLNEAVMMGRVIPSNADEKLTVSLVDTYFGGKLAAGVSSNSSVSSDNVVTSLSMNKTDDRGGFAINVKGSTLPGAGFATLHLDTDKGGNKAVEKFGDILVTVRYPDITGVSVNNVIIKYDNASSYSTMRLSGLIPGQIYRGDSVSGNETETVFFVPKQDGTYTNKKFKNSQVTINRYNPKEKTIPEYKTLYGKERIFSVSECLAEPSRGLFFDYQKEWVYTGNKITPVVKAYNGDVELIEGQDFTVSYKNNLNAGSAVIVIKGKNGSSVEKQELHFTIKPADIADATIITVQSVKGKPGSQPVVVYNGLKMSQKNTFKKIAKDQLKAPEGYIIEGIEIQGSGNFEGTSTFSVRGVSKKVKISAKLSTKKFAYAGHGNFDNDSVISAVTGVTEETAYIVLPDDENFEMGNAGSYKLAVCGTGDLEGTVKHLAFKITPSKSASFSLDETNFPYDPLGVVLDRSDYSLKGVADEDLIEGLDYTTSYSKNKKAGTAKVTITFKGSYKGTKKATQSFAINQANIENAADDVFVAPVASEKKAKKNAVYITVNDVLLKNGKKADYITNYVGGGKMTIQGTGNYTGSFDVEFTVGGGDDVSKAKLKVGKGQKFFFNGHEFTNEAEGANNVSVTCNKSAKFRFFNNVYKGKAVCVAYGDGEATTGSKTAKFTIKGCNIGVNIEDIDDDEFDPGDD